MRNFVALSGIWGFLWSPAFFDDATDDTTEVFSPSQRVMIVDDQTQLFVGEQAKGKVPPGSVFRFTKNWAKWLYLPAKDAWVQQDRVIPIEQADAYFTNVINGKATAEAFHHRGIARIALGYHELALEDLNEAARLGLNSSALFVNRAIARHNLQNDRTALQEIERAIEIDPENALAYNIRCLIWASMGSLDRALADATRAIRLDPSSAGAFHNRGVTKVKLGRFQSAIEDYNEAIRLQPEYAEAFANRGFAYKKLAEYHAALEDYRQAATLAPQSPQAFNDAAWLVATCPDETFRDGQKAVEYARHACELTEFKNGDFIDTLAAAYAAAGQFDEAVKAQQQALTLLPEEAHPSAKERLKLYVMKQPYHENR